MSCIVVGTLGDEIVEGYGPFSDINDPITKDNSVLYGTTETAEKLVEFLKKDNKASIIWHLVYLQVPGHIEGFRESL